MSHGELPGTHPEPAGDGDAGLAMENSLGPQLPVNAVLSLLSFPFGLGVHLNISRQIKAPRQLPTNYQVDLPQYKRSISTDRGSFAPVFEI